MAELYAEDVNYWKSGTSAPDTWIDRARKEIAAAGGKILNEAFGRDEKGRAAYLLEFAFGNDRYKAIWPVLKSRSGNERAARIQAATMLYHDVKARCVSAKVLGIRAAFLTFLALPDGRTAAQASAPDLIERFPKLLTAGDS